jgi:hypothetical protein
MFNKVSNSHLNIRKSADVTDFLMIMFHPVFFQPEKMSPTKFYPEVYCDVRFDPVGKSWLDLEKFLNHREPEKLRPSNVVNWRRMQNR